MQMGEECLGRVLGTSEDRRDPGHRDYGAWLHFHAPDFRVSVTVMTGDGITRGHCISFETLDRAGAVKLWLDSESGTNVMKKAYNSTSYHSS